jgi:Tol biopolymer transport system component
MVSLDGNAPGETGSPVWSADGQWIVYTRTLHATQETQVARIRPGAGGQPEILAIYKTSNPELRRAPLDWSPTGEWIVAARMGATYFLVSPDFTKERKLTSRVFFEQLTAGFSKDGRQILAVLHDTSG